MAVQTNSDFTQFDIPSDLTVFQTVQLCLLCSKDSPVQGTEIGEDVEKIDGEEPNSAKLYNNLDTLADKGLISKKEKENDGRANVYEVTSRGEYVTSCLHEFLDSTASGSRLNIEWFEIPHDLSMFKITILCILNVKTSPPHGLEIAEDIEELEGEEPNAGRLYPNLERLAVKGLVKERQRNGRTKEYTLTKRGKYVISTFREFVNAMLFNS